MKLERVPWRQAIEVSVQEVAKLRIGHRLFVTVLHQSIVHVVSQIVSAETPRRRRALSDALDQIHTLIFFFHCYFTIAIIDSIVLSRTFMTDRENLKLLNIDLAAEGSLTVEK